MLNTCFEIPKPVCYESPEKSLYERNFRLDMKDAMDLFFKFKEDLEKLHRSCKSVINKMLQERY